MNKEVRNHFDKWYEEQSKLTESLTKFLPCESHVVVRVYRYVPEESTLVDTSKRIYGIDGVDLSKKRRERNYPIAFILRTGHIPEDKDPYGPGDIVSIPLTLCEDRINPRWEEFNEQSKERPVPTTIKVPPMFIEGLNAWANHKFVLDPLDFESDVNENLFLIPTAFLKGVWDEI